MKKILLLILGILLAGSMFSLIFAEMTFEQQVTVTIISGIIKIYSPINNSVYNTKIIPINITMSDQVSYLRYSDNGGNFRILCQDCNEYGNARLKRKSFDDGFHKLIVLGIFGTDEVYEYRNFTIDSLAPIISKTLPKRNSFTNGSNFYIKFKEENPALLSVSYNPEIDLDLRVCEENRDYQECYYNLNLTKYDGSEIEYSFKLADIANNTDESRLTKIIVDTTSPKILKFANWTSGRYAYFNMTINETNLDAVQYIDTSNPEAKWKTMCSSLKKDVCYKRISFRAGQHNVLVRVLDKAGNSIEKEAKFMI